MCLTQSAVSRQIIALEAELGRTLFIRKHRTIELASEGRHLFEAVTRGLDEISSGLTAMRVASETPQITVATSVAFAYFWLMPRLERFSARHPDIDLRVLATDQMIDLRQGDIDVAVLYGDGTWKGVTAHKLFGERVYPVCSPGYLKHHPDVRHASDLIDQTLLHLDGGGNIWGAVDWQLWLAQQGVSGQPLRRGIRMNSYPMVLQGAEAGNGVALGWSYITDPMLAEGRLVCPVDAPIETLNSYYIGALQTRVQAPEIASFLHWIKNEVRSEPGLA